MNFAKKDENIQKAYNLYGTLTVSYTHLDVYKRQTHPTMVHQCLEKATTFLTQYCKAFKDVGANGVIIAEPVAGILSANLNHTFSVTYAQRIVQAVQDDHFAVIYHNCGNNTLAMANDLLEIHAMGYHFGNAIALKDMLDTMPTTIPVLGNLDPLQFRDGTPNSLGKLTIELLEQCAQYPNFIISSGCDLTYLTPWENIDSFFKAVKDCLLY